MKYQIDCKTPPIHIEADSVKELEQKLSYLNPLCIHTANIELKSKYELLAFGIGPDVECKKIDKNRNYEISYVLINH